MAWGQAMNGAMQRLQRPNLRNQAMTAMAQAQQRGGQAEDEYYGRATSFDPYAAVETASQGAWQNLMPDLKRQFGDLNAGNSAVGRLRGGFGGRDEEDLFREATDRLQGGIMQNAVQAASMDQRNIEGIGGYGERQSGRYLDLLTGERDRELEAQRYKQAHSGGFGRFLGGIAGMAAGSFLGPMGASIGSQLGSRIGGGLGKKG